MTARTVIVTPLTATLSELRMVKRGDAGADVRGLTRGLAAGEEEAFRQFHTAYFDRLLRYLTVVTRGDEQAARDALQETLTRVARHARRFDTEEMFWSWLTVLARSAAADGGRKRVRYWRLLAGYALSWLAVQPPPAASEEADKRLHSLLMESLENLAEPERTLIQGKYLHGASVAELAAQLNLSEKAVEARLSRARRALREQLLERLKNEEAD